MLRAAPTKMVDTVVVRTVDHLALRVQLRAAELGLFQTQVAERCGFSLGRLCNVLDGRQITVAMFRRICGALELAPDDERWTKRLDIPSISLTRMKRELRNKMR